MKNLKLLDISLHLFDGTAGAPAGEAGGEQTGASELPKAEADRAGRSRRSRAGDKSNVVYGIQEQATSDANNDVSSDAGSRGEGKANKSGVSTTSSTLEDRRAAFDELISGEYKDIYTEKFQQAFNRRFKEVKGMEDSLSSQKPIIDMLMQKYKIGDGDMKKLQSAIEQDNTYWESAAEEAGLTVEQYRAMQKLERENAELRRMRQRQVGEQQAQQQLAEWYRAADKVKELYPSFDFKAETANREFMGLLKSGVPVQKAYELVHMDEIKEAAAKAAAKTAGAQVVANIKNKAARPSENGTSSQSAVIVKNDVKNLSREDRAEIARRVLRGEKISF